MEESVGVLISSNNIPYIVIGSIVILIVLYAITIYYNLKDNKKIIASKEKDLQMMNEHQEYNCALNNYISNASSNLTKLKSITKHNHT